MKCASYIYLIFKLFILLFPFKYLIIGILDKLSHEVDILCVFCVEILLLR